ncbi:hypothetical protein [Wenxinia marina]|uniref:Uncharacterized protein n=1 Tax=Wenxinia marina DSM 24838 TaxID=1123501 RepID=A0A0D0QHI6_9RHOB|nr:hypothetical protein [Wenxinia marina]KIQ70538.1 hypothetical protein Wenmar_00914 [Wenxinia marina DSM 24838]GGL52343.1 hypothetical protein GCM10011392_03380 [Wenxinia marina]
MAEAAALAFAFLAGATALFQLALAAGAPWGHLTLAGAFPGVLPRSVRLGAAVQAALLAFLAAAVLSAAGLAVELPRWTVWVAVAVSALSTVGNAATPSRAERRLWLPVAVGMLATSLAVALIG